VAAAASLIEGRVCKFSLAAEVLMRFGELRLRVTGSSMIPGLWPADLVTIRSTSSSELSRGDIVLFFRDRRFFVHRVLDVSAGGLLTRGDSVPASDPPVSPDELLGRVVSITGAGGTRAVSQLGVVGRLVAFAARRSTVARNLLLRWNARYRRLVRSFPVPAGFRPEAAWPY